MNPTFKSSLPPKTQAIVSTRWGDKSPRTIEYRIGKTVVAIQGFDDLGALAHETVISETCRLDWIYRYHDNGQLMSLEHRQDWKEHGTTCQWDEEGTLLGSYTMVHGTGWDIWRQKDDDVGVIVREARHIQDGERHGREWWVNEDQESIYVEECYWEGLSHGIERNWNYQGRLRRGYPKYWIHGVKVDKRKYLRAAAKDATLPPFRIEDNLPQRTFPPEVAQHLGRPLR